MSSFESRYAAVSRRALMKGALAFGALGALPALAGCGSSDEEAFDAAPTATAPAGSVAPAASQASDVSAVPATSASSAAAEPVENTEPLAGAALPDGAELVIDFTFTPAAGGRVRNPYIAVWIEDTAGSLVRTVSLWYRADEAKYLRELTRWNSVDGSDTTLDTISSATRVAGAYSLVWDGTDSAGVRVPQGDYVVQIEAAREKGPYELVTGAVTLGSSPFAQDLGSDGELTAAAVQFVV